MKTYRCKCGATVFFENTRCVTCGRELGFLPDRMAISALEPARDAWRALAASENGGLYRKCRHYEQQQVCNWMVPVTEAEPFCEACRLNEIIPNLDKPENRERWLNVETAKRRLIYELKNLGLPVQPKRDGNPSGLAFRFLEDPEPEHEFADSRQGIQVLTGHAGGVITINILEADDVAREQIRRQMNEAYRTLLGHFRHESGHYYWTRLIERAGRLDAFRAVFGDERNDYNAALDAYYRSSAPADWYNRFISAYASAHPWEDWAECWAHYLQMVDALETAWDMGLVRVEPASRAADFDAWVRQWMELTVGINALNRSLGLRDAYPFVLTDAVIDKLRFVDGVVRELT